MQASNPLRFIVIGAGMSGLLAAIRLRESGNDDVVIYEKGERVGGTWRENRYPGLTCDVPAHCYTYSLAPHPDWSAFYATGREILGYFEGIVERYGLSDILRLREEVIRCEFIDGRWHVTLASGKTDVADAIIAATGVLHHPNLPEIPGLDDFKGSVFHSARWDDTIEVDGRRVGVIGNGSTGVQIVSALSKRMGRLVHFQRSPQWIVPVENFDYTEEQRRDFRQDLAKIDAIRHGDEYWSGIQRFNAAIIDPDSPQMAELEAICLKNLQENVVDPMLREVLRPAYRVACKRLIYSTDYYKAVQRPGVVVERGPIERIEAAGIHIKDGAFHELDVLVLATGFMTDRFVRPIKVVGRQGILLDDVWAIRPKAYLAIAIPDFPNFFLLNGPTGPVGNFSLIDVAERQWTYIAQLLERIRNRRCRTVTVRQDALEQYEERRLRAAKTTVFASGCTSWYLDSEGFPATWPWTYDHFAECMERPDFDQFEFA